MNKIRDLGIKKNDIVRIKFKDLNTLVLGSNMTFGDLDESLRLTSNMRAYYNGGDFLVGEDFNKENYCSILGDAISVKNHFDHDYDFLVYDFSLESIEIVSDARRFVSSELDLIVVRVDDELFINGKPLIGDIAEKKKDFSRRSKNDGVEFEDKNMALLKIFEEFITDMAMRNSFKKGD